MFTSWKSFVTRAILNRLRVDGHAADHPTPYQMAKGYRLARKTLLRSVRDAMFICFGIFSAAFGLKGFLLTNHFIDGGATGISLLLSGILGWPLFVLLTIINIPFVILGYRILGKQFAIKTALAITGLVLVVGLVPFPDVTQDNLLVAVFGGFFLGAGIGMAVRGGAVIDGTEVLAIAISRRLGTTIGDVIMMINIVIFASAAYFLGVPEAMYSMITYLAASKTLDFIVEGIEEYIGVTIISTKAEALREMIINRMGKGVTVYSGKSGYGKRGELGLERDIVFTVVTRLELPALRAAVQEVDPRAFIVQYRIDDAQGGIIKKRAFH